MYLVGFSEMYTATSMYVTYSNACCLPVYSSMFFDADHDLAHEFYEEVSVQLPDGRIKLTMRRIKRNLQPQVCYH